MFKTIYLLILSVIAFLDLLFLLLFSGGIAIGIILVTQLITTGIGFYYLRKLDFNLFFYIDASIKNNEPIVKELWDELIQLCGACLLILPGFLSDIIGILALIPDSRRLICDFIDN